MHHCCNWTIGDLFWWHHHKWTFDCTIEHLIAYALSIQSSCDLVLTLLCTWTVNSWTYSCNIIAFEWLDCWPVWHSHSWTACTYSTLWANNNCWPEVLSQLPICLLLRWHCNSKWSISIQPYFHVNSIWVCEFVKKEYHPSHHLFFIFKTVS